jgi:predicted  nucleic acid-binding Zn-ribbon protein
MVLHVAAHIRNPRNAPGPFYVLADSCISCGAPQAQAPELVAGCGSEGGCYFRKQPETQEEIDAAIRATFVSCIEVYRYGGEDPEIRRRLAELGYASLCDNPIEGVAEVVRDRVRFTFDATHAATLAAQILAWVSERNPNGACTEPVVGDAEEAAFEHTHSAKYAMPLVYRLTRLPTGRWLLVKGHRDPWLHDLLVSHGARELRWFSEKELAAGAEGRLLPY